MLINMTCPAEVFRADLPTEDFPAVSLSLYNLGDRVIVSVEVTLKLLNGSGAEKERVVYRGRALNGRPHSTFRMSVPCTPRPGACTADVTVDKVWYNDNDVWRRELSASVEYTPNNLPASMALTNLKFAAGETAVGFPSQQDGLWVCVCGRPNPDRENWCARCRRQKSVVFSRYNREAVESLITQREKQMDLATRGVREDTTRMQRVREEEYNRKQARRTRRVRLALCLLLCIGITAATAGAVSPILQAVSANRAMADKDWAAAARTLDTLGDFPGAAEKKAECIWQEAKAAAETAETADELKAAADRLRLIPDRPESLTLADETDLARARMFLDAGDPEAAREAVAALPETDGRRIALENECLFTEAKAQMGRGEYEDAREAFLLLTAAFPEAAELAAKCVYIPACTLISEGRYDEAIAEMSRIPDYPGSRDAILECHYKKAAEAEEAGDLETASAEYLMAGEYGDAPEKTRETVFSLGEQALAAGDAESALKMFASLPGYEPAAEREKECILILARQALENRETEQAAELLASQAEEYREALELVPEESRGDGLAAALFSLYYGEQIAAAREAAENGDYALAVTLLDPLDRSALPDEYEELNTLYETACLKAGEALYQAGRPYEAIRYFRLADNERKTRRWLNNACYLILGRWADRDGTVIAEFREDSTCTIAGEDFTFLVPDSYTLKTEVNGGMEVSFRITALTENRLSLRDMREGRNAAYEMWRAAETAADETVSENQDHREDPDPGASEPDGTETPEDFRVKDGE